MYIDSPPNCPGEEGLGVPATSEAERAYAAMLLVDGAVRITIEPVSAALAGQQPRDLAGRIRALVQQKAGEWADEPDMERAKMRLDILRILRLTLAHAKSCGLVDHGYVEDLRSRASSWRSYADVSANATQAADELEAIVRECAPTEET